jgi:uncharacterized integral membrane protein
VRYLGWVLKAVLFLLLLGFAVKNTGPVVVRYYLGNEWQAPLVFVLLVTFALGVALGILASMSWVFRQRRELAEKVRTAPPADGGFEEGA